MTASDPAEILIDQGVPFGDGGDETLHADVYRQPDAKGAPAVLLLRSRGVPETAGMRNDLAVMLARRGVVALVPEFRVGFRITSEGFQPYAPEIWPAGVHDTKAAIRWTRANASWLGVDDGAIFLLGGSNAGLIALGAAGHAEDAFEGHGGNEGVSSNVSGVIAVSTPTTLSTWGIPLIVGENATPELIDEASAVRNVHPGFPPTLLLHGTDDPMIPPSNSTEMYAALRAQNVPAELHLFAGQDHALGSNPAFLPAICALVILFVSRYRT